VFQDLLDFKERKVNLDLKDLKDLRDQKVK